MAYCIHEGNKYEGHTMLPVVTEFVRKYKLEDFIVVADSGLMNSDNVADLEANGYKYIIGAKIKAESKKIKEWILSQPKNDCQMIECDKGEGKGCWSDIPQTVPARTRTTATRVYAGLKKPTAEDLSPKSISTSVATTSSSQWKEM